MPQLHAKWNDNCFFTTTISVTVFQPQLFFPWPLGHSKFKGMADAGSPESSHSIPKTVWVCGSIHSETAYFVGSPAKSEGLLRVSACLWLSTPLAIQCFPKSSAEGLSKGGAEGLTTLPLWTSKWHYKQDFQQWPLSASCSLNVHMQQEGPVAEFQGFDCELLSTIE